MRTARLAVLLLTVASAAPADRLYVSDIIGDRIVALDLQTQQVETVVSGISRPVRLAVDEAAGAIWWITNTTGIAGVYRANLDGTNVQRVVPSNGAPISMALDPDGGKVYWSELSGAVWRANVNGSNVQLLAVTEARPQDISLELESQALYVSAFDGIVGEYGNLQRIPTSGGTLENVISDIRNGPVGTAVDIPGNHIYYGRFNVHAARFGSLDRADLDGSNRVTLVPDIDVDALQLDLHGEQIFFTTISQTGAQTGSVLRCDLDGGNLETLLDDLYPGGVFYVPEPATLATLALGVAALRVARRRLRA